MVDCMHTSNFSLEVTVKALFDIYFLAWILGERGPLAQRLFHAVKIEI